MPKTPDPAAEPQTEGPLKKHGDRLDDQIPREPRRSEEGPSETPNRREPREDDRSTLGG